MVPVALVVEAVDISVVDTDGDDVGAMDAVEPASSDIFSNIGKD